MAVITVGAEKGGVGKTRLSTHIAAIAAREGVDVVLLDTDKQGSAISWSRIRGEDEDQTLKKFPVLALPPNPAKEVQNLSSKYDLVVVDIGAQNYRTMLECASLSDIVLVPCGADQQEIESTLNVFDHLKDLRRPPQAPGSLPVPVKAYVVLSRVSNLENSRATKQLREYFIGEGVPVFDSHIAHRSSWLATGRTGRAVHELKGKDRSQKAVDEMQAVFDEITRRVAEEEVTQ
ncbi:AAA family ATPase [Ramlibacter albus]|uniref:AAA family ATPase n=1 Tax=Ramlibacter albus TaxID=2079448 RepID=A0A923MBG8_9BURK|nr:AAA family ATPase [Ramlibacter albus]MBC5767580.1 AAA family ATPase [Ramlibacter albus]